MKRLWIGLLSVFLLAGCGAVETFETMGDVYIAPASATIRSVSMTLPEDATVMTMGDGTDDRIYLCDGYTIAVQTVQSGDMEKTLRQATGFSMEKLKLIKTDYFGADRYDCVWSAAGETGDQVCRCAVIDDGEYHYIITTMASATTAGELTKTWNDLFGSVSLVSTD